MLLSRIDEDIDKLLSLVKIGGCDFPSILNWRNHIMSLNTISPLRKEGTPLPITNLKHSFLAGILTIANTQYQELHQHKFCVHPDPSIKLKFRILRHRKIIQMHSISQTH